MLGGKHGVMCMTVRVSLSPEYQVAIDAAIGIAEARRDKPHGRIEARHKKLKNPYQWKHLEWRAKIERRTAAIQKKINYLQEAKL
jgi:hypothetical protein